MAMPIVTFTGLSNSGKTTLVESIIGELTRRGYRIAVLKHTRRDVDIDREGKDSWRHRRAGAVTTVLASPRRVAVIEETVRDLTIEEIRDRFVAAVDILLVEGHKSSGFPKIVVIGDAHESEELRRAAQDATVIAIACDREVATPLPCHRRNDIVAFADLIENRYLTGKVDSTG